MKEDLYACGWREYWVSPGNPLSTIVLQTNSIRRQSIVDGAALTVLLSSNWRTDKRLIRWADEEQHRCLLRTPALQMNRVKVHHFWSKYSTQRVNRRHKNILNFYLRKQIWKWLKWFRCIGQQVADVRLWSTIPPEIWRRRRGQQERNESRYVFYCLIRGSVRRLGPQPILVLMALARKGQIGSCSAVPIIERKEQWRGCGKQSVWRPL